MSDCGGAEDLSEELIEDLRLKGLLSFVVIEQSSNSAITLLVYENEKYRPIVREWGSAVGIHILPPLDRRPFTDDLGNHSISGPLSEIEPIKGFKWLGNWTVTVEKGTDKDGYQYAQGWSKLNSKHTLADHAGRLRFVRRRQWTRVMVVDPDPPAKRLPYELEIRILGTTVKNLTSISQMEAYVDTYFNDVLHSTTFVSQKSASSSTVATGSTSSVVGASGATATTCTTTVIRPLYSLDPHLKISFVVHKNRLSTASSSNTGRVDMLLNHFLDDKNKGFVEHEYQLPNTSNRFLQLAIEVREQKLFTIDKVNPKLLALHNHNHSPNSHSPAGADSLEVVLSPRLKDKIIILSLAIESDCNGLLDEIVGFLTEAMHYVTELDLFDIIDDINQMYKKSEFSKLITLLQDSDHPLKSVMRYPAIHAEWCVYTKVMALPQPNESDSSANNSTQSPHLLRRNSSVRAINPAPPTVSYTKRYEEVSMSNERFLKYQPCLSRDHSPGFLKVTLDAPEMANITPGLRGYRLTICCADNVYYEMVWTNFYEYIQIQKIFSILKYQPEEVNEHLDCMFQVVYYPSKYSNEAPEAIKANLHLSAESSCFQLSIPRNISSLSSSAGGTSSSNNSSSQYNMDIVTSGNERPTSAANNLITIGFDEIEYIEVGCSHHISAKYLLEVKLLSLQAQLLRYMMQNKTYLELDTADGQHFRVDLNGSRAESFRLSSTSSFPLNDTLRLLIPGSLLNDPTANIDEFLYMTINTDGAWDEQHATDITQRSQALQNDPDTYYPTQSISAGSFRAESKSKSMFSSKKSTSSMFATSTNSKIDSSDRDKDDAPRLPVNRTVIKLCNRVAIPLSGLINKISTEQESQVTLFKLNCKWALKVFRIEGLAQKKSSEQVLTYFTAYLADCNGEPILYHEKEKDDPTRSPSRVSRLSKATSGGISGSSSSSGGSSSGGSGVQGGWIHRSAAVSSSHTAAFTEAEVVDISTEKQGDSLNNAKYVLVQFWNRSLASGSKEGSSSGSGGDVAVGEILIPLLSALKVGDDSELNAWNPDAPSKHRVLLPSILSAKKTSQTVNTGAVASVQLNMCNHQNFDYEASDRSSVKLITSLKPIQSADCSWPCRFLNKQLQGVEAEVFYFFPAHDGLHIFCKPYSQSGDLKRHPNSVGSVLSECLERKAITTGENRLQLVVPYSQVSTSDMHIITDNMLALTVALKRCIKVAGSNLNSIQKEIKLELLVGPCLAKDLYTIMHNRISLFSIRSTLSSYATDKRKEEQEVFDNVAKMLQDEILATMESIDQFVHKPSSSVMGTSITCRGSSTVPATTAVTPSTATHDHSHLFPLKLLYLKKAALKIYLWFLIEQTKLSFTSKTAYLESSWLIFDEFNTDTEDLNSIYEDTDALMQRVGLIMENLDRDVRCMVFQAHKTAKKDISERLSAVVYDKFLVVINYLMKSINLERSVSGVVGNEKIYTSADPQKKRDLIKFIITHDNMFEVALNSSLRPHDYQFSLPPLLSICIDFELLIEKFAALVNENILLWNARTFEHFRVHKDNSSLVTNQDFAPWAVTSMIEEATEHELFISNIPETIQTQLNVEIGLKKVPITDTHMGHVSLQRVVLLNQKISAAIAKVYLALASEYEKVLVNGIQSLSLRDKNAKLKNGRPVTEQDKDDMICFLMSLINDCHRMYTKHIPDSMSNFLEEEDSDEGREDGAGAGLGGIMDQSCMLFLVSSRAMEAVSQNAINQLSNQIFFMSELRVFFLLAFDAHVVRAPPSRWTKKRDSMLGATAGAAEHSPVDVICATLKDFFQFTSLHLNDDDIEKLLYVCTKKVVLRYLLFLRDLLVMLPAAKAAREKEAALREKEAAQKEKETKLDKHHDVLHRKSLGSNLLPPGSPQSPSRRRNRRSSESDANAIGRHLDMEKGLDKGLDRKLSHLTLDQTALKDAKKILGDKSPVKPTKVIAADSSDDENLATDGDDDDESESERNAKHARDVSVSTASSGNGDSLKASEQPADKYGPAVEGSPLQREEIYKIKTDLKSIIRLHSHIKLGIQAAQSAAQAGTDSANASFDGDKDKEGTEYQAFFNNSAANLFGIVQDVANRLIYGEISETSSVDDVIYSFFSITPPAWNPDRTVYERNLAAFLELNSNFIQQNENGDASRQAQHSYTIQISNLSCVKQNKHKNCFVRVLLDNQVRETAVRSSSMIQHATSWDGTLTFNNIQGYENKVVELQLMGYRLRALQHWRERLIGSVKINLSVLAQSSPYIADVAPTPSAGSSRGKSFAARMSMSESAHFRETSGNSMHGSDAGNLGNSIILANHCAWFVVDKKSASSDSSAAGSTSVPVGGAGKDKSGVKGTHSANSVVGLLSSETVRMDLDETQLRVGIKMIRNGM